MSVPARSARALAVVLVTGWALAAVSGCGSSAHALKSAAQLRVGYDSQALSVGDVGTRLALSRYTHQAHQRLVELPLGSPQNEVTALLRGDVDVGSMRLPDVIKAVSQGAPIHAITILQRQREFVLVAGPKIGSVRALVGKSIAENGPGTDSETLAKVAIRGAGLRAGQVRLVAIPNGPARAAALLHGTVEASAVRYSDYLRVRAHLPGLRVLARMPDLLPGSIAQTLVVSDAFAARNGATLKSIVADLLAGFRSLYGPTGSGRFVASARSDVLASASPGLAEETYAYYRRIKVWPTSAHPLTPAQFAAQERVYIRTGQLSASQPFAKVWNVSFW